MSTETGAEMTCKEFVELVTDLIEGQLAEAERVEAEIHLGKCHGCTTYLEQGKVKGRCLRAPPLFLATRRPPGRRPGAPETR